MKKQFIQPVVFAALAFSVLLFSCKKSDDSSPAPETAFSYSANGTSNNSKTVAQLPSDIVTTQDFSSVAIDAKNGSVFGVNLAVSNFGVSTLIIGSVNIKAPGDTALAYINYTGALTAGTYNLTSGSFPNSTAFYSRNSETGQISENTTRTLTGTLEITSYDASSKKISGKFSFTQKVAKDGTGDDVTTKVENGVFTNIPLQSLTTR